jgi:hypothetical protein
MVEKELIEHWMVMVGVAISCIAVLIGLLAYWQKCMYSKYKDRVYGELLRHGTQEYYKPWVAKQCFLEGATPSTAAIKMLNENRRSTDRR